MRIRALSVIAVATALYAGAAGAEDLFLGHLSRTGGRFVFALCDGRTSLAVEDRSPGGAMSRVIEGVESLERAPYAELFGAVAGGSLVATGVNRVAPDGSCERFVRPRVRWRASGSRWSLTLSQTNYRIVRFGHPDVLVPRTEASDDGRELTVDMAASRHHVWIHIYPATCRIDAGSITSWEANITIDGSDLHGCAWKGGAF